MAKLTATERKASPHAGPHGSFPIPDMLHARLALQMAHFAKDPAAVKAKVKKKFPSLDRGGLNRHATESSK